jgi:hypothetical protein
MISYAHTMYRYLIGFSIGLLTLLQFMNPIAYAAECTVIYGGGEIPCATTPTPVKDQPTPTPTKAGTKPTATPTKTPAKPQPTNPPTTKGGLPVHPPTQTKTTPPTGPEALSVIGLIPMAAAGWYIRKKK